MPSKEGSFNMDWFDRPVSLSRRKTPENIRLKERLTAISKEGVQERVNNQYLKIMEKQEDYCSCSRGVKEYLDVDHTAVILPGHDGRSARDIIVSLGKGSKILDVACGVGRFLQEVKREVNPDVEIYGYDGLRRPEIGENLGEEGHFVQGKLNDLSPEEFNGMEFDIVTNVATSNRAEDYFGGGLRAMTSMLKENGLLLVSTLPKVLDQEKDTFMWDKPSKCAGVFRPDGTIVNPAEYFSFLEGQSNGGFSFEYSYLKNEYSLSGKLTVKKLKQDAKLNLDNVFYAQMERSYSLQDNDYKNDLSYIIAETPEQAEELRGNGFISVGDLDQDTNVPLQHTS